MTNYLATVILYTRVVTNWTSIGTSGGYVGAIYDDTCADIIWKGKTNMVVIERLVRTNNLLKITDTNGITIWQQ